MDGTVVCLVVLWALIGAATPREYYAGSKCKNGSNAGICTPITQCSSAAKSVISTGSHPYKRCGFADFTEIVCCPNNNTTTTSSNNNSLDNDKNPLGKDSNSSASTRGNTMRKSTLACDAFTRKPRINLSYHIVGGEFADPGEFPHMAALAFWSQSSQTYKFDCGGTLISDNWIITAAHCIVNAEQNELKFARLGEINVTESVDQPDTQMDYAIDQVTIHPNYQWKNKFNDIALARMERSVQFGDYIYPACLYSRNDDPREGLWVSGWGTTQFGGSKSAVLQKANLTLVSLSDCNVTYFTRAQKNVIDSQICAYDSKSDACQGDSGGPLQVQTNSTGVYSIVGVISYGLGCGGKSPGIYTRIYSFLDWIENTVWP